MGMMINRRRAYGGKKGLPAGVVDMGLPSGTLWAQGNIIKDANGNYAIGEPSDYGCYFSWGNIDGHNKGDGYNFNNDNYALTPGSQLTGDIPSDDALHDAAVARLGNGWHMHSSANFRELLVYCTWTWTAVNGHAGYLVTSKRNGNTLFLPASGGYTPNIGAIGGGGYYWSRIFYSTTNAYSVNFYSRAVELQTLKRNFGATIRPVL